MKPPCQRICFVCENYIREETGLTTFLSYLRHMQLVCFVTDCNSFCNVLFVKLVVASLVTGKFLNVSRLNLWSKSFLSGIMKFHCAQVLWVFLVIMWLLAAGSALLQYSPKVWMQTLAQKIQYLLHVNIIMVAQQWEQQVLKDMVNVRFSVKKTPSK